MRQALFRLTQGIKWPELEIVATAPNGVAAVEQALALRPDILFLDIKMPGQTGIEAAEELAECWDGPAPVSAVKAFEHAAADYVLKPVNEARLATTVERLRERLSTCAPDAGLTRLVEQLRGLLPATPEPGRLTMIRAAVGNVVRMIPVSDVVFFQAVDKYVNEATRDSEVLIRLSLKELMPQLDATQFCQISRGTVVNMTCVASAGRDTMGKMMLTLRNRSEKPRVSPLFAHVFRLM